MTDNNSQAKATILDLEIFEDLHSILEDGFHELLTEFIRDTPPILNNLTQAVSNADFEEIFLISHALYGTAGNLGVIHLSTLLKQIQQMAKSENIEDCIQTEKKMEAAFEEAKEELLIKMKQL